MVKATVPSILNTFRNIFMRLYGSVEEVRDNVSCPFGSLTIFCSMLDNHSSVKRVMSL